MPPTTWAALPRATIVATSTLAFSADCSVPCFLTRLARAALRCAATAVLATSTLASCATIRERACLSRSSRVVCLSINVSTVFSWLVTSAGSCEFSITASPIRAGSPLA